MKWLWLAGLPFAAALVASVNPQLKQVQTVYILPMGSGMDQFLADQITKQGLLQVVTDPQRADAILTDRIGEAFEDKLQELYPRPKPVVEKKKDDSKTDDKNTSNVEPLPKLTSSFGGGKGTFFLVDRKTRNVVWSDYDRPRDSTPHQLEKTADRVTQKLKRDLQSKE
ncbi:MAG TPA: hypothetical protein VKU01_03225 [Bryobacteraceae bacterium]|nr:hypothetical protein [Bryobacteraceae bacterium]